MTFNALTKPPLGESVALSLLVSCYWPGALVALCTGRKFSLTSGGATGLSPRPKLHFHGQTEAAEVKSQVWLIGVNISRLCSPSQLHVTLALDDLPSFLIAPLPGLQCVLLLIQFVY